MEDSGGSCMDGYSVTFTDDTGKFVEWHVQVGRRLASGSRLFSYDKEGRKVTFRTSRYGIVRRLGAIQAGQDLKRGDEMAVMSDCDHSVVMKDLCANCGADLRGQMHVLRKASISMIHSIPELQVSREEAIEHARADEANLLANRKLVLLVDLDQTLIHTTNEQVNANVKDVHKFQLEGPNSVWYYTRLRPHTCRFLKRMSEFYELHICTFGARLYAHKVANILDPDGSVFGNRILSRDECFNPHLKIANVQSLFPCGEHMVCIIDDREDVWNYVSNLVHVRPYRFFKHTGDINAPPGFTKTAKNTEQYPFVQMERAEGNRELPDGDSDSAVSPAEADGDGDDYLLHLEKILQRIHAAFYEAYDATRPGSQLPSLCTVVPSVCGQVLKGVNIVFSGIVPNEQPIRAANISRVASMFGAVVQDHILTGVSVDDPERTTHLVAARPNTMKVLMAEKMGIFIVNPDWLWCSVERWIRADESRFPLDPSLKSMFPDRVITIENSPRCKVASSDLPTPKTDGYGQKRKRRMEDLEDEVPTCYSKTSSEQDDISGGVFVGPTVDEGSLSNSSNSESAGMINSEDEEIGRELEKEFQF